MTSNSNSHELVLFTGATGHVGYATLLETLKKGYNVRAAIRRESAINNLKRPEVIHPYLSQLTFVIVPDLAAAGAFDTHVKGVDHIIHVASPIPNLQMGPDTDYTETFINPAVNGTLSILHSALKEPSIKRVVITSSAAAIRPTDPALSSATFTADTTVPSMSEPFANPFAAYTASKIAAHNAVQDFVATQNPRFSTVSIMPSHVIGPNALATNADEAMGGSNLVLMLQILGINGPWAFMPFVIHLHDVAFLHVAALDPHNAKIKKHDNFGATWPQRLKLVDANEVVKRRFPEQVKAGLLPANGEGKQEDTDQVFDTTRSEEVFGFKFKDLEAQVVDIVEYYLKFRGRM